MTDTQIFAFLVMPFLFALSCSAVFFSRGKGKPEEPLAPSKTVSRPNMDTRKPRNRST